MTTYLVSYAFTTFPLAPEVDLLILSVDRGDRCAGVVLGITKLYVVYGQLYAKKMVDTS